MSTSRRILPGQLMPSGQLATLGVMGGGQLGRMFVQAAQEMGYFTAVLDPDPASPAGLVSHFHIQNMKLVQINDLTARDIQAIWQLAAKPIRPIQGNVAWSFEGNGIRTRTTFIQAFCEQIGRASCRERV